MFSLPFATSGFIITPKLGVCETGSSPGGGINTYGYVSGRPLGSIDPLGLWDWATQDYSLPQGLVDFSAGAGDTLSFNITSGLRDVIGIDGGVNKCSTEYFSGEMSGIGMSLAFGGAHLGRNAWNQRGKIGGLSQGVRRLVSESRQNWANVQRTWSQGAGGYKGKLELHHWFSPQSKGGSNAGWNYMPVSPWLNNRMSDGGLFYSTFRAATIGIYGAAPTAAFNHLTGCECNR